MNVQSLREHGIGFEAGFETMNPDRPTLLMIHGAGGRSEVWRNQVHMLEKSVNTLALDLPGHGNTPGGAAVSISAYAQWLINVLEDHFDRPPYLMGHSMGGAIVQDVALSCPEKVNGMILAATGPRLGVAPAFLEGLEKHFDKIIDTIMAYAYAPGVDSRILREGAALMRETGRDVVHGDFSACNRFDVRARLSELRLPCLILCGDKDQLTPPALSAKLNQSISGSRLEVIPSGGHMVMIERPGEFNAYVLDFISERDS